jgi:hypothetical protein
MGSELRLWVEATLFGPRINELYMAAEEIVVPLFPKPYLMTVVNIQRLILHLVPANRHIKHFSQLSEQAKTYAQHCDRLQTD